ncbi:hypothetical protein OROHE_007581 [Orobanche hederae]
MASYQLIEEGKMGDDVESALQKTDNNNNINNSPSCYPSPSASGSGLSTSSSSSRVVSLDIFRGFTVVLMIFVDDASGILPTINHSLWNGLTLLILLCHFSSLWLVCHLDSYTRTCLTLDVLDSYDASSEAKIYMVKCGVRGDTGPACNATGMIDRMILGVNHLYRKPKYARTQYQLTRLWPTSPDAPSWCQAPFDPEGCLRCASIWKPSLSDPQASMAMRLFNSRGRSSSLYLVTESMIIFSFQALPLYLDRIFNQYVAIILSLTFVIFWRVIPQAICTRYGLAVGANFVWLLRILMLISYPISYPIEKILDWVLGHNDVLFRRAQLNALVPIHSQEVSGFCVIVSGAEAPCTIYGLAVGENFVWLLWILMLISYPISYTVGKILDCVLRHNEVLFRRPQLKALVSIHSQEFYDPHGGGQWKKHRSVPSGLDDCKFFRPVLPDPDENRIIVHLKESHKLFAFYPRDNGGDGEGKWELITIGLAWEDVKAVADNIIYLFLEFDDLVSAYDITKAKWLTCVWSSHAFLDILCFHTISFCPGNKGMMYLIGSGPARDEAITVAVFRKFRIKYIDNSILELTPVSLQSFRIPSTIEVLDFLAF